MQILYISGALLFVCVLSTNGYKLQAHGHDQGRVQVKKISFSVTHGDHDSYGHGGGDTGHSVEGHKVEHHANHVVHHEAKGHTELHGHQGLHTDSHGHEEHHVEHHGNNGHDDHQHGHHEGHADGGHVLYEFKYGVKDPKTGDIKQQWEARDGDKVKGVYSLKEADGTKRIVEYTSDKKKGFEATVHKIGHANQEQHGHAQSHGHDQGHHDGHQGHSHGHATSFVVVKNKSKH